MKRWQQPIWSAVALWAMLTTLLPSLAWACPMGAANSAALCRCNPAGQSHTAVLPCRMASAKCCRPVPLPSNSVPSNIIGPSSRFVSWIEAVPEDTQRCSRIPLIVPTAPALMAPSGQLWRDENATLRFNGHGPPAFAGRAPPSF